MDDVVTGPICSGENTSGKAGSSGPASSAFRTLRRVLRALLETSLILLGLLPVLLEASWAGESGLSREKNAESFGDERLFGILENALKSNPNIAAAVEKVVQAREDVRSAISALGPTVGVGASARHEPDRNVYNASLNLIQTLYAGGSLRATRRAAELALSAVESGDHERGPFALL